MSKVIGVGVTLILLRFSSLGHVLAQKETDATLPKPPHCGAPLSDRLREGPETFIDEFPWTALIEIRKPNGQTRFGCGGSLINSRYVLTTAYCVHFLPKGGKVTGVRLGEWDQNEEQDCEYANENCADAPVNMGIEKIIVHEDYGKNDTYSNDIALIRLNRSVDISQYISPVCLPIEEPQRSQNKVGLKGYIAGWGHMSRRSSRNVKVRALMEVTDLESCDNRYRRTGLIIKDTQMCAKGFNDSCSSVFYGGSPFTKQEHFNNYLYGFASIGSNNCVWFPAPEMFTNVAKYIGWIESKLE